MIRRHPLLLTAVVLTVLLVLYRRTAAPLKEAVAESWYQQVERRLVQHRSGLLPPARVRHFGLYRPELPWELEAYFSLADELGVRPRIVSYYQAWGEGPAHEIDVDVLASLTARALIPLITWEPWLTAFGAQSRRDAQRSARHIVDGEFDDYLRRWARGAVRVRRPFLLRPFHELGNPAYPWTTASGNEPELLGAAFRHVVQVFREEGADNVAFVWSPYTPDDLAAWPGDEWVDWIGLDLFNYGTSVRGGGWTPFATLLDWHLAARRSDKPVLLAEVGCSGIGGDRAGWWADAFRTLERSRYGAVQAVVIYDNPAHREAGGAIVDWGPFRDPAAIAAARPGALAAGFDGDRTRSR